MSIAIIFFLIRYRRRTEVHISEKVALQNGYEKQLLQSRIETQEKSFQNFSEEIHDNVGQVLSVVGMQLYQLQQITQTEHARQLVEQSITLLNKAINDLRNISHTLNTDYIERAGLIEALRQEISYINSAKSILCTLRLDGESFSFDSERQTILFRIIQESLANALKHGNAKRIEVKLKYAPGKLSVAVADNGVGFRASERNAVGLGLSNMQVRAALLGGDLEIESIPGHGTTVRVSIQTETAQGAKTQ